MREAYGAWGQWRGAVLSPCLFGRTVVGCLARDQGPSGESGSLRDLAWGAGRETVPHQAPQIPTRRPQACHPTAYFLQLRP